MVERYTSLEKILKDAISKKIDPSTAYKIAFDLIFEINYEPALENAKVKRTKEETKEISIKALETIQRRAGNRLEDFKLLRTLDEVIKSNLTYKQNSTFGECFLDCNENTLGNYNCVMYADIIFLSLLKLERLELLDNGRIKLKVDVGTGHIWPSFKSAKKEVDLNSNGLEAKTVFGWDALLKANYNNLETYRTKIQEKANVYRPDYSKGNEGYG